jgi:cytochrome bd ubiquinol oxidase subunit II
MFYIVLLFLGLSLLMYLLFGGADFGAGILEAFSKKSYRREGEKITYHAIGPVWEANHIWLILVVVILFMGFPKIYSTVSIALHIPLTIMLLGIILRGCSFTFRHYDAIRDQSHKYYSGIFILSSIFTSVFMGIIAGALILGEINISTTGSFYQVYVAPWFNFFCISIGIFTSCIFSFLAAVYLIGETEQERVKKHLIIQARNVNIATVVAGVLVFISGHSHNFDLLKLMSNNPLSVACLVLASLSVPLLWLSLKRSIVLPRILAGFQVVMILFAWTYIQYPIVINLKSGEDLTLFNSVAPEATINSLGWALIVGSLLILPALFYLLKAFKWQVQEDFH